MAWRDYLPPWRPFRAQTHDTSSTLVSPSAWLLNWAMGGRLTTAGMAVGPVASMTLPTYYACLRNISEDIGKLPLHTYERLPRGKRRAIKHPAYALLHDAPNSDMTAMTFRETLTHHALAWGNGYAEIVRDARKEVLALWPIHPSRVQPRRDEAGELVYDVYGNEITLPGSREPLVRRLRQESMLHIRGLGAEGYEGYSIFRLAAESLGLGLAAQTFGAAFFGNGAAVGAVLEHPATLTPEAQRRLRESWQTIYGGPTNAMKVAVLEEGMKYTRLGIPPEEAQFLECVTPETLITMANGLRLPAATLVVGDQVMAWDGARLVPAAVKAVGAPPLKPLVRITTARGRTLTASEDHPVCALPTLRTPGGRPASETPQWIAMGDLKEGSYVRIGLGHLVQESTLPFEPAYFLGAMVGDGSIRRSCCSFSAGDDGVIARMRRCVEAMGGTLKQSLSRPTDWLLLTGGKGRQGSRLRQFLNSTGLIGRHAHDKFIPTCVLEGGPAAWRGFLSGYLDTDGSVSAPDGKGQPLAYWSSTSYGLLEGCQHLLALLGVQSGIYPMAGGGTKVVMGYTSLAQPSWGLYVTSRRELAALADLLDLAHTRKAARLATYAVALPTRYRAVNFLYDRVVAVDYLGEGETVGLEIAGLHTHVTGGIITHNTRQFQVEEVCRWFRMPKSKIHDLTDSTYSNMEQQNLEYVPDTLMPWITRWEQEYKRKIFVDEPDYFAEHAVQGLLRGDQAARASFYKDLFGLGALSPNEIRALENQNEIGPAGDTYWVATNNYQPINQWFIDSERPEETEEEVSRLPSVPGRNGTNGLHPEDED